MKTTKGKAYILRQCAADMTSRAGKFQWPESGEVSAPDWKPTNDCGNGLHGFLWGEGDGNLASYDADKKWIVAEISEWIDLGGKVKFPRATVCFTGSLHDAAAEIRRLGAIGAVIGSTNAGGDYSTNAGGYRSTNTGGNGSTNTGGYGSTNTGSYGSTNTGDDYSTNTGGDYSTNTGGIGSTNTGGDRSTNTGGERSTNTGGDRSILQWKIWDGGRYRMITAYVGEGGIEPNVAYMVRGGNVVKA